MSCYEKWPSNHMIMSKCEEQSEFKLRKYEEKPVAVALLRGMHVQNNVGTLFLHDDDRRLWFG